MSAFTAEGFAPAEEIRTPGSRHTDRLYRDARIRRYSPEGAVRDVYLAGALAGDPGCLPIPCLDDVVPAIYARERAAGRHHGEALDEVFLAGYVAARSHAFTA